VKFADDLLCTNLRHQLHSLQNVRPRMIPNVVSMRHHQSRVPPGSVVVTCSCPRKARPVDVQHLIDPLSAGSITSHRTIYLRNITYYLSSLTFNPFLLYTENAQSNIPGAHPFSFQPTVNGRAYLPHQLLVSSLPTYHLRTAAPLLDRQ
jgi:hypothetical protein